MFSRPMTCHNQKKTRRRDNKLNAPSPCDMMARHRDGHENKETRMRIGVPKELKPQEFRVGLTPTSVREYVRHGHAVVVETGAGVGIQAPDEEYASVGATIAPTAKDVFDAADMIVKIKEPQPQEYGLLREGQILFTYLHLAAD